MSGGPTIDQDGFDRITRHGQNAAMRLHVRSALNPMLWLCAICTPSTLLLSVFAAGYVQLCLLILAAIPVLCACFAYTYWMLKAPNRLQSEDYQLRQQALGMIYEKGSKSGLLVNSVVAITNPAMKRGAEE